MNFNQNYFSYHQPAQSFGLGQEPMATEMPYGGSSLPGTQFPQGMPNYPPPMQNPYGGSALPGTGAPDINNYPNGGQLTPWQQAEIDEAEANRAAEEQKRQQAVGAQFMGAGFGAQSQDPSQGIGMMQLKSMTNRTGQEPYQNFMPQIAGYRLPRGV